MSFIREMPNRNVRKIAMRRAPSTILIAKSLCSGAYRPPIHSASFKGTNLYKKMKKAREKIRFRLIAHEDTSADFLLGSVSSRAALAEKRRALMPRDIACPSVPKPRRTGKRNRGYRSDTFASGCSWVTMSPDDFRTAMQ